MSKTDIDATAPATRLFQVNFAQWGEPVMVFAPSFREAAEFAVAHQGNSGLGPLLLWDATDEWAAVSDTARVGAERPIAEGKTGVAYYDENDGWFFDASG